MSICCCNWFNKQADRPIAEQDNVRQESQIKNDRMRNEGARGVTSKMYNELNTQNRIEVKTTWQNVD